MFVTHPFPPVYDGECTKLILGTMPSPVSREVGFYYGHPQNRFWKVLAAVFDEAVPNTIEEKRTLVLKHHIALWDVLNGCDIIGAADSKIKNPAANDFYGLLSSAKIKNIYTNGTEAYKLYTKLCRPITGIDALALPSTSPANARFSLDDLISEYGVIG